MHGAFKTTGGKLVAVDFSLEGDKLRNPRIHGDFFLYPDEALEPITAALDGIPADLPEDEIAARVRAAIPEGTEWRGAPPAAGGLAVRRARAAGVAGERG